MRIVLFVIVLVALDLWALYKTWQSDAEPKRRYAWAAIIVLLPMLGLLIWSLAGPRVPKPPVYRQEPP